MDDIGNKAKVARLVLVFCLFVFGIGGCAMVSGDTGKKVSRAFVPKKTYDYSYEDMWARVITILKRGHIQVLGVDKDNGMIHTGYTQGPIIDYVLLNKITYRYKYDLNFEKVGDRQTHLEVVCLLEAKKEGKGGAAYEATQELKGYEPENNPKISLFYENWLYEQIEKGLEETQSSSGQIPPPAPPPPAPSQPPIVSTPPAPPASLPFPAPVKPDTTATIPVPPASETTAQVYIKTKTANLREQPNTKAKVLFLLKKGTRLTVLDEQDQWYRVKLENGKEGWVAVSVTSLEPE